MAFGIYVHIPYCVQRCKYCDFVTFEQDKILSKEVYTDWLVKEIYSKHFLAPSHKLSSIYFGGGTPSLLSPQQIQKVLVALLDVGFVHEPNVEITIEINPATVNSSKLQEFIQIGINRFSVGAQSFNDNLLKLCGRLHNANDTRETLNLLKLNSVNYSFDLLFALPTQTLEQLKVDVDEVIDFSPQHLSSYCLTVPEGHPMSYNRPVEDEQLAMFDLIEDSLKKISLNKYEISNFSKPGFESRHNSLYWSDDSFWGLGASAHSYFNVSNDQHKYGYRFWNPSKLDAYGESTKEKSMSVKNLESLKSHESITDYCHMFLRTSDGLNLNALQQKYPMDYPVLQNRLHEAIENNWLKENLGNMALTRRGERISNQVFQHLTFSESEVVSTP